jgi:hypothetical protein
MQTNRIDDGRTGDVVGVLEEFEKHVRRDRDGVADFEFADGPR